MIFSNTHPRTVQYADRFIMNLLRASNLDGRLHQFLVFHAFSRARPPLSSQAFPSVIYHARRCFAQINGNQVRVGNVLEYKGKLVMVKRAQAVKPGKGGAFNQVELRDIRTGTYRGSVVLH